ncbi:hypothetical protein ACFVIN_33015 [Streptomyces prasinus]
MDARRPLVAARVVEHVAVGPPGVEGGAPVFPVRAQDRIDPRR